MAVEFPVLHKKLKHIQSEEKKIVGINKSQRFKSGVKAVSWIETS